LKVPSHAGRRDGATRSTICAPPTVRMWYSASGVHAEPTTMPPFATSVAVPASTPASGPDSE